jgi:H+/Cl- antiporter ClcA
MGIIAFLMELIEEFLIDNRNDILQNIIGNLKKLDFFYGWLFLIFWSFSIATVASAFTVYIAPSAYASGIPEIMAILNGVKFPDFIGIKPLIVKIISVSMGIGSSLCIGKEGPLAHIGAIIGHIVIYLPVDKFKYFRNDESKREFLAAGVSAGISAAFASPIGGTLFSYELSKPTTFWTFSMIWRIFFCSSVSTFTLSILN